MRLITKLWATLLLLCVAGVANATTEQVVHECDYSNKTSYPWYAMGKPNGSSFDVADGTLVITNPVEQTNNWDLQPFIDDNITAESGCNYIIRLTYKTTVAGNITLNMGTWSSGASAEIALTVSDEWQTVDGALNNYNTTANNIHILLQMGKLVGTVTVQKVQLIYLEPDDPLAKPKQDLSKAIAAAELQDANYKTEESFATLQSAIATAKTALEATDATVESLEAATKAVNDAVAALQLQENYSKLTAEMFMNWDKCDAADATAKGAAGCSYVIGSPNGLPYGDGNVSEFNYADLSEFSKLIVIATAGTPRIMMNRDVAGGNWSATEAESHLIEYPKDGWSSKYFVQDTTSFTVDLKQIVADKGFAHLNAIKGANWNDVTVTGMYLYKAPAVVPVDPTVVTWDATTKNYENGTEIGIVAIDEKINAAFDKNTNSNAPKYYTNGTAVRVYGGNTITISGEKVAISKVEFTFGSSDGTNDILADKGTYAEGVWTISENTNIVKFTIGGTTGNRRIAAIKVTYAIDENAAPLPQPVHIANTAETAYTVAEAVGLIDAGEALSETVFVKGIVSQVDKIQGGAITYWISADGTTEGQQFECYKGKNIDGADFAAIEDVEVGAEVIVKGTMTKYGEVYEFNQGNELVSYKAPFKPLFADGKYYIYNVGAQKYLAAGANWGTHAVVNATGLDYEIKAADGKYTLDSQVSNGGDSHFLNGEWNDGKAMGWIFAKTDDGCFTISNGEKFLTAGENGVVTLAADATAEAAHWTLKTLDNRLAELAAATVEAPVDATFLIQDADFGRNDLRKSAWKMEASNQNLSGGEDGNGTVGNNNAESYHSTFTLSQTLSKAPAGKYKMTAQGFYRQDDNATEDAPVFYANEKTAKFPAKTGNENSMTDAAKSFSAGQYTIEPIEFTVFDNGQLTIGAKGTATHQWVIFDNFRLTYLTSEIPADEFAPAYQDALAAAQAALNDAANAAVTGEERTALEKAIADFGTIPTTTDSVKLAISTLNAATSTFTGAKAAYDALTAAKTAKAEFDFTPYPYASATKIAAAQATLTFEATSAADATAKTDSIACAFRKAVESNAMLEGLEGAINYSDSIAGANAEVKTGWTGSIGTNTNEGYTDGEGVTSKLYLDGGWSSSAGANIDITREVKVPAGKYILTATARGAAGLTEYTMSIGGQTVNLPHIGAGVADGVFGRGWNDAFVEFESTGEPLTLQIIAKSEATQQWMSINRFRLVKFPAEVEPEPIDPDLVEIPQDQQDQEAGVVTLATFEKDEKTGVTTYTTKDNVCVIFKMKNVDVSNCDYILFKFAEPTPAGLKYAFWTNNKNNDLPAGVTEFKYVFAEDNENEIKDGIIPEVSLLTIFAQAGKVVKVKGVYKHIAPVKHTWDFTKWSEETVANLKAEAAKVTVEDMGEGKTNLVSDNGALWSDHEKAAQTDPKKYNTTYAASKDNCFWYIGGEAEPTANGEAIAELKGLEFNTTYGTSRALAIAVNYPTTSLGTYDGPAYLWFGGKNQEILTIKNVKAGTTIKMGVESHKLEEARGVKLSVNDTELTNPEGQAVEAPKTYTEQTWQIPAGDGVVDVVVKNTNGCHIYFIDAEIGEAPLEKHTFEGYVAVATTLQGDVQGDVTTAPQTVTLEETETDNVIAVTFSGFSSTIPPVNFSEFTFNATIDADETLTTELYEVAANSKVTGTNGTMTLDYTITGNGSATSATTPTFALKLNQNPMMTINVVFAATADDAKAALLKTTGIINIARDAQKNVIFNLNGQKVNKAQKGLYIINGKKVVNK